MQLVREVLAELAAVNHDLARASNEANTCDGALTATDGLDRALVYRSGSLDLFGLGRCDGITDGVGELFGSGACCSDVSSVGYVVVDVLLRHYCATCLNSKVSGFWPAYGCSSPAKTCSFLMEARESLLCGIMPATDSSITRTGLASKD